MYPKYLETYGNCYLIGKDLKILKVEGILSEYKPKRKGKMIAHKISQKSKVHTKVSSSRNLNDEAQN